MLDCFCFMDKSDRKIVVDKSYIQRKFSPIRKLLRFYQNLMQIRYLVIEV